MSQLDDFIRIRKNFSCTFPDSAAQLRRFGADFDPSSTPSFFISPLPLPISIS